LFSRRSVGIPRLAFDRTLISPAFAKNSLLAVRLFKAGWVTFFLHQDFKVEEASNQIG
jgi:hypothetical protein